MVSVCPCYVHTERIVILLQKQMHDENHEHRHYSLQAKNRNLINVHILNPGPQTSTHTLIPLLNMPNLCYIHTHTCTKQSFEHKTWEKKLTNSQFSCPTHFPIFPKVKKG